MAQNLSVQEAVVAPKVHDFVLSKLTDVGRFSGTWNMSDFWEIANTAPSFWIWDFASRKLHL